MMRPAEIKRMWLLLLIWWIIVVCNKLDNGSDIARMHLCKEKIYKED